ncbi:hypothetical protein [Streptomyces sp. NPDC127114]
MVTKTPPQQPVSQQLFDNSTRRGSVPAVSGHVSGGPISIS